MAEASDRDAPTPLQPGPACPRRAQGVVHRAPGDARGTAPQSSARRSPAGRASTSCSSVPAAWGRPLSGCASCSRSRTIPSSPRAGSPSRLTKRATASAIWRTSGSPPSTTWPAQRTNPAGRRARTRSGRTRVIPNGKRFTRARRSGTICQESGKRLVLFVENLDVIFGQLGGEREVHSLRASLIERSDILLVGSANTVFEAIRGHGEPFYEFFRLFILEGLGRKDTAPDARIVRGRGRQLGASRSPFIGSAGGWRRCAG